MQAMTIHWSDLPLFAGRTSGLPFQKHSRTSILAADKAAGNAASIRERVYQTIKAAADGLTDLEIQALLGIDGSTERPRRIELLNSDRIKAIGTRKTPSGRLATVWGTR